MLPSLPERNANHQFAKEETEAKGGSGAWAMEAEECDINSWHCRFPAVWPWAGHLTSVPQSPSVKWDTSVQLLGCLGEQLSSLEGSSHGFVASFTSLLNCHPHLPVKSCNSPHPPPCPPLPFPSNDSHLTKWNVLIYLVFCLFPTLRCQEGRASYLTSVLCPTYRTVCGTQ